MSSRRAIIVIASLAVFSVIGIPNFRLLASDEALLTTVQVRLDDSAVNQSQQLKEDIETILRSAGTVETKNRVGLMADSSPQWETFLNKFTKSMVDIDAPHPIDSSMNSARAE